jgi:hypothetical protein
MLDQQGSRDIWSLIDGNFVDLALGSGLSGIHHNAPLARHWLDFEF